MSLKSIDMQLAVHKSPDAGIKQNEIQQKPVQDQSHLANQAAKDTEKERNVAAKSEAAEQAGIRDGEERRHRKGGNERRRSNKDDSSPVEDKKSEHPYKGKFIDLQL
ncbi:hypothetical protein [Paenibacillus sp. J2TS4]|uniref:hypothetical protein n=1 Tax=Paenibacillus sp. J2TS4 TaxID=2807194 RepID=UPI001B1DC60F|nr:hypothetical protein [Paenibacillus sp. J2TS4]GIP33095.1 hypothetical protein J2TS4_23050 [Paenibacillus sp. J2TS4]